MWWRDRQSWRRGATVVVLLAAAGLTAGCFEPVYGTRPALNSESVQDRFAGIEVKPIVAGKGTPTERVAVGLYNALQFNLHNGGSPMAPTYRLVVQVGSSQYTAVIDATTGRPDTQIEAVSASFQLIEISTGKAVVADSQLSHVDYDIPGSQQRFAGQRARRDAEDHAVTLVAEAIRNRLASYFVAGT
jgi:LPS-assembly lipoprotein